MAVYGKIDEFNLENGDWVEYEDRLEQYFIANNLDGTDEADLNKKKAILLSSVGSETYSLVRKLCAPVKPAAKTFAELCQLLKDHQNPKPSVIMQRFRFNTRVRKQGETIAAYVAELRKLCEHCDYPADMIEEMLRDRLVCGVNNDQIQRRLLAESKLTYKSAIDHATAIETASRDLKDLQGSRTSDVNRVQTQNKKSTSSGRRYQPQQMQASASSFPRKPCYRCDGDHDSESFRFKNTECHYCHKVGHIDKACKAKKRANAPTQSRGTPTQAGATGQSRRPQSQAQQQNRGVSYVVEEEADIASHYEIFTIKDEHSKALIVTPEVAGHALPMELDTGAAISLLPRSLYDEHFASLPLLQTGVVLRTYSGEKLIPEGKLKVPVVWNEEKLNLDLTVVKTSGPALLGRDWMSKLKVQLPEVKHMTQLETLDGILNAHKDLFKDELGKLTASTAKIFVKADARPHFLKARSLPYAMRTKVEAELSRLTNDGIIEPVQFSDWAAPVVPVKKGDGNIRLCGDYKTTINQESKLEQYPIPQIEDLFAALSGGKLFTKLDMSHAYQQLVLDPQSRKYTTISTHKGLFQYTRLFFGIASAPAIFQRTMEGVLQGIPHVCVYLDDVLITGGTEAEHLANLREVLKRMTDAGLKLKQENCLFMQKEVS